MNEPESLTTAEEEARDLFLGLAQQMAAFGHDSRSLVRIIFASGIAWASAKGVSPAQLARELDDLARQAHELARDEARLDADVAEAIAAAEGFDAEEDAAFWADPDA